jgi:hypothetical protein
MAKATGEISASDGGLVIPNKTGPYYVTFGNKTDVQPPWMAYAGAIDSPHGWEISAQITNLATETTDILVDIDTDRFGCDVRDDSITATLAGEWTSIGTAYVYGNLGYGSPPGGIDYSPTSPAVSRGFALIQKDGSVGVQHALALDIKEVTDVDESATSLDYEVTCSDTAKWTPFDENRSCSSYLMKYILCGNYNRIASRTRNSRTIPL